MNYFVHETSVVDGGASVGENTKIWHFSHIQTGAVIGKNCSLGQNVNISNNVHIGDGVKIQNNVSVYEGVVLEDYVFCGPSCVFTNDLTPRSRYPKNHKYQSTVIRHDVTLGANCTIVCGHEIGHHATIAAGAVVVSGVKPHALMAGVPAKQIGWVCECGQVLRREEVFICPDCGKHYILESDELHSMERSCKMRIYLDHNVFIQCLNGSIDIEKTKSFRDMHNMEFVYGPAHMEEIYRVASDNTSPHKGKMKELLQVIKKVTNSREILPALDGLSIVTELPESCYQRVKGFDTTQIVENDSLIRFGIDTEHYKKMLEQDKHNQSISNLSAKDVWKHRTIAAIVSDLNNDCANIVERYNNSPEIFLLVFCYGLDRSLLDDFSFERHQFNNRLKGAFNELEFTIEILMRVLNFCGYNSEKTERTAVSSTHDVTHCIYGTECDYIITMDKRFARKCEAVYEFIGAGTKVMYCQNGDEFTQVLDGIVTEGMSEEQHSNGIS